MNGKANNNCEQNRKAYTDRNFFPNRHAFRQYPGRFTDTTRTEAKTLFSQVWRLLPQFE
jgi:hypothetical protein